MSDAAEQREPHDGQRDAGPDLESHGRAEEQQPEERRQDDVEPGDEAGARNRCPLEPGGLQPDPEPEQPTEHATRGEPGAPERQHAPCTPDRASTPVAIA